MHLIRIPKEAVDDSWPAVIPHLSKAFVYAGDVHDPEKTKERAIKDLAQLWVVLDDTVKPVKIVAAAISRLDKMENGKLHATLEILGGEGMKSWFGLKEQFEKWARAEGCTAVRLDARKGWAKHLKDYKITHYAMAKELEQ